MEKIKIKYFDKDIEKLTYIGGGKSVNLTGLTFVQPKLST